MGPPPPPRVPCQACDYHTASGGGRQSGQRWRARSSGSRGRWIRRARWTSSERPRWGSSSCCALQWILAGNRRGNRCPLTAESELQRNCGGGRKWAPCHVLSSYLEATSGSGAQSYGLDSAQGWTEALFITQVRERGAGRWQRESGQNASRM